MEKLQNKTALITNRQAGKKISDIRSKVGTGSSFSPDDAYQYAIANHPGAEEIRLTLPSDSVALLRIRLQYPYTIIRKQNTFYFDQYTGEVLSSETFKNYAAYDKIARSNYDFHVGSIRALGIGSKIIYFLVALIAASLPVSGFYIWWGRKKKKPNIAKAVRAAPASSLSYNSSDKEKHLQNL